jgi:hypothetical protein
MNYTSLDLCNFSRTKLLKIKALLTIVIGFSLFTGYSQTDCKPYVPAGVGSTWELTSYSKKDKVTGNTKIVNAQ